MQGTAQRHRAAWQDRFRAPTAAELLSGLPKQVVPAFEYARTRLKAAGLCEEIRWQGVWRWTFVYTCSQSPPRPTAEEHRNGATNGHNGVRRNGNRSIAKNDPKIVTQPDRVAHHWATVPHTVEPSGYLVPDPLRPRLCLPIRSEQFTAALLRRLPRTIRDALTHAPEVSGVKWAQWDISSKAQVDELCSLLPPRLEHGGLQPKPRV